MKRKATGGDQQPEEIFDLAEAVAAFYGTKWAGAVVERFRRDAKRYRDVIRSKNRVGWLSYVIRLVLTCPVLLERLPGLEWVFDDLRWALNNRRFSKEVNRDFWKAMGEVRTLITSGRPANRARDFLRYQLINAMINPVTMDPEKGIVRVKGRSKTKAIEKMAEMEEGWSGRSPDVRGIWRSFQWVEDYLARMKGQLEEAQGSQTRCPLKHR